MILKLGSSRQVSMTDLHIPHDPPPQLQQNGDPSPSPLISPTSRKRKASEMFATNNSPIPHLTNGVAPPPNGTIPPTNGLLNGLTTKNVAMAPDSKTNNWPAEIPHLTEGYGPIAHILQRLTQDTFRELQELIRSLVKLSNDANLDPATIAARKKKAILTWAETESNQWIKMAIIQQWAERMPEIYELVDLKLWLGDQQLLYDNAGFAIGQVKKDMVPAMLPPPDVNTAVQTLSGQVPEAAQLDFKPKKRLSSKELLKMLRQMNIILSIRLSQIASLPPHLRGYIVKDGRATFAFPHEFELDITVGDENPESPLYFLDLRLNFASKDVTHLEIKKFRDRIGPQIDFLLASEGIAAACQFLNELVLTFKLNLLRQEAVTLAHSSWTDSLQVSQIQRTIVLQYWSSRPGPKSWLEIGIASGDKIKDATSGEDHNWNRIAVRWFRQGQLQKAGHGLLDEQVLSVEGILAGVTSLHFRATLKDMYEELRTWPVYSHDLLTLDVSSSAADTTQSYMDLQMTANFSVRVTLEARSGLLQLHPPTAETVRCQGVLNAPIGQPMRYDALDNLRGEIVAINLTAAARDARWDEVQLEGGAYRNLYDRLTGLGKSRLKIFRPPGWSSNWMLVVCLNRHGDRWQVVGQIGSQKEAQESRIPLPGLLGGDSQVKETYTATRLADAQAPIASVITDYCLGRALTVKKIPFEYVLQSHTTAGSHPGFRPIIMGTLSYARSLARSIIVTRLPSKFKLGFQGISGEGQAVLAAEFQFNRTRLMQLMGRSLRLDSNMNVDHSTGRILIRFPAPIGSNPIAQLGAKIQQFDNLLGSLISLKRHPEVVLERSSLDSLLLRYSEDPYLAAEILQEAVDAAPPDRRIPLMSKILDLNDLISLKFRPEQSNPHRAVKSHLTRTLTQPGKGSLDALLTVLLATKTMFTKLAEIAAPCYIVDVIEPTLIHIFVRRLGKLDMRLVKNCFGALEWYFTWLPRFSPMAPAKIRASEEFRIANETRGELRKKFMTQDGDCWLHLDTAFCCTPLQAGRLLDRVNEVISRHAETLPPLAEVNKRAAAEVEETTQLPPAKRAALAVDGTPGLLKPPAMKPSVNGGKRVEEAILVE